jgi:CheY-like chemotaxis protein
MSAARRILVVEDDDDVRELIATTLEDHAYAVDLAVDGRQALERVAESCPELILLDMKMPRMNGWEFARLFREQFGRVAPIVVVTASADAQARAAEIGAEGHLGKPFSLAALLAVVARHLP